ncbi:uncharacterized protein B0I36DRAFT_320402 [Microdochium trichocladiopsis]|uniref:MARVEL domain-containing protein n=1 Tax=Microdochium trichocladiopsis TaxID=1682393 RepID=A0A9P8Y895_9PEZI|nr:uncharacterized protein B0I36DRAFT_320402 [Microdochium trichocladiopsis]KAH7032942.1 hypothetical protein B0I36DRAFT_320402 [Microdochium trichocladiopsis]
MGAKSGFALKFLQWFIRGIQFCCCALTLALFSYFLASASRHNEGIPIWARAVEGISGIGVIHTAVGLLLLCCLAGHPATSFIAIVLDIAFVGAFIYVAQANRGGAGSCRGYVDTVFGSGYDNTYRNGLPTFGTLCRMQTAVFAVSIVAIIFFILSALMEFVLVRHRRKEKAFGPSPGNNYTSGYAKKRGGLFGKFGRKKHANATAENPNQLPTHTTPDQMRQSYATDATAVGNNPDTLPKHSYDPNGVNCYRQEPLVADHLHGHHHDGQTAYPDQGYRV